MPQFRKKPVVIEAVQYAGSGNMNPRGGLPDWLWGALETGVAFFQNGGDPLRIHTLEGDHTVSPNDWIIRGVKGELYPCKPDIFAATYEPAAAPPAPPAARQEQSLREKLWVNHGCPLPTLYGDDGEMQCNNLSCRLDFKRMPLAELCLTLIGLGRLHAGIVSAPPAAAEWQPTTALELLQHVAGNHSALNRNGFIECSCGMIWKWPAPPVAANPQEK